MQSNPHRGITYTWVASLCCLALFVPFSISGDNISLMIGFMASIAAIATSPVVRARYKKIFSDPMFWPSVLLIVSALPSVLMSENFSRAFRDWRSYWQLIIYFFVAYNLVSERLRRTVFWILVASMSLSCLVALTQYRGGFHFLFIHIEPETLRPGSTLYKMTFAGVLYQVITSTFAMLVERRRLDRGSLLLGASLIVQITAMLINLTRGAWMALLAGFVAVPMVLRRKRLFVMGLALVIVIGAVMFRNPVMRERAESIVKSFTDAPTDPDIGTRFVLWDISWEILRTHPLLGIGMGDFTIEAKKLLRERHARTTVNSHNIYLQTLATRGIIGFVPFLFFWFMLFRTLFDARRRLRNNRFGYHLAGGVIAVTVAVLVGGLSENNIDDAEVFTAFMLLVGLVRSFVIYGDDTQPGATVAGRSQPPQTSR